MVVKYTGCLLCLAVPVRCPGRLLSWDAPGCPASLWLPWTSLPSEASPSCNDYHWQLLPIYSPLRSGISPAVPCSGSGAQQSFFNLGNALGQRCTAVCRGPRGPPWASPGRSPDVPIPGLQLFFITLDQALRHCLLSLLSVIFFPNTSVMRF